MALVLKDRVKETTTTTGTGTVTLAGAATGFQSFSVIGDGNTTYYTIAGTSEWEVGIGTYTASGTTLSRDTVLASSNSNNLVSFSAGSKDVFVVYPAGYAVATATGQTFTAAQTFRAANAIRSEAASTQDAVVIAGRAGGTSSYAATITPTTLSASRTVTLPDASTTIPVATQVLTFSGPTAARTITLPDASFTAARTDAAQTFTGTQTCSQVVFTANAVSVSSNAGTVPITSRINNFTNSSAATMTITMATASAVDGQMSIVRIFDFSAVAQTISWVNTENSTVSVPTTSNGSTTLPLTVGFMYNNATSKWRCIASA